MTRGGDSKFGVEFVGDSTDITRAFQQLFRNQDKLNDKFLKVARDSRRASSSSKQGLDGMAQSALGVATAITGINSGLGLAERLIGQLKREFDDLKRRQQQAGQGQVGVAAAQREAMLNLGAGISPQQLNQAVRGISQRTGASQSGLFQSLSTALSFKGNLSFEDAVAAVETAARITPGSADAITTGAQGILAQQKTGGGTAEQVAGQQFAIKQTSPVASSEAFARNIAPAIAQLTSFGDTTREAGALLSAIGQGSGDPTGQTTATAAIQFAKQLAQELPNVQGGTQGRLGFLRSDAGTELRSRLLGSLAKGASETDGKGELTGEAKAFTTLVGLLQREQAKPQQQLDAALKAIPTLDKSATLLNSRLNTIDQLPLQVTANVQRRIASAAETLRLGDIGGGRAGIAREGLEDLLSASGLNSTARFARGIDFDINTAAGTVAPVGEVVEQLRGEAARRTSATTTTSGGIGGRGVAVSRRVSAEDSRIADALLNVASQLESLTTKPQKVEVTNGQRPPVQTVLSNQ